MTKSSICKKGGPRTKKGKAVSKMNAISHGVTALSVPPGEQAAFKAHRQSIVDAYQPANAVEEFLCDRISMLMWRARRLDAWEASRLESARQTAIERTIYGTGNDISSFIIDSDGRNLARIPVEMLSLADIRHEIERVTADRPEYYLNHLDELEENGERDLTEGEAIEMLPDPLTVEGCLSLPGEAVIVLGSGLSKTLTDEWEVSPETIAKAAHGRKPTRDEIEEVEEWTLEWEPEHMPGLWSLMEREAKKGERHSAHHIKFLIALEQRSKGQRMIDLAHRAGLLIERAKQSMLILADLDHVKLQRYDTGIERSLFKAMHELEAIQEKRQGGAAPLARVEVHGTVGRDE